MSKSRVWQTAGGVILVLGFIFGFVQYDDRLAKCDDVKEKFKLVESDIENIEIQTVQTFQQFRKEQDYRHYDYMSESLTAEYWRCKNLQRAYPMDPNIPQDCESIEKERDNVNKKKREMYNSP